MSGKEAKQEKETEKNVLENGSRFDLDLVTDRRHYKGHVTFERFTFPVWRKWRRTVRNKKYTKDLEKLGYDADEQAEVVSYWSGAAILQEWDISYDIIEGREKGTHVEIAQPVPGEEPDNDIDYVVFQWFRRVANEYLLPRLGMFPKS